MNKALTDRVRFRPRCRLEILPCTATALNGVGSRSDGDPFRKCCLERTVAMVLMGVRTVAHRTVAHRTLAHRTVAHRTLAHQQKS